MFDQLKPLMQNGERYIVVEGGRPEYVLMRFADYATLAAGLPVRQAGRTGNPGHHAPRSVRTDEWERANAELEEVRNTEADLRTASLIQESVPPAQDPTTIRLEDLPL